MTGLDKIDFKILQVLQANGRITNIQLSQEVGLSPAPTLERVRKLETSGFIKSYHAIVDSEMLGLGIKTFIEVTINYHKQDAIKNFIKQIATIEEVVECHHVAGAADFLLKIVVKDVATYERLMLDKLSKIQEIGHLQTMMILSTAKSSSILPLAY